VGRETRKLLCWAYDLDAPSLRHRWTALTPALERAGWSCRVEKFPRGRYVRRIVERGRDLAEADVLWLSKIKPGFGEHGLLRARARRIVFDFDDAIWLRKPKRVGQAPDDGRLRQWKFDRVCALADVVVAGNEELAGRAARRARRVEIVPTTVDVAAYGGGPEPPRGGATAVWIGLPENLTYLERIRPALAEVARRHPAFRLRVVCSTFPDWNDVPIERVRWTADGEIEALRTADIGVMPLDDDAWTRGKCAFKLIQYMAAGLACVASPVGANRAAVVDGETGLHAADPAEWFRALDRLLTSAPDRTAMGRRGRARAESHYDRSIAERRVGNLLDALLSPGGTAPGAR